MSFCGRVLTLTIIGTALASTGCGDTHLSLEREWIAVNKELSNSLSSAKNMNEMFDRAPQVESAAARIEKLAERRSKLQAATESEKSQIAKMRQKQSAEFKDKMDSAMKNNMNPKNLVAGGIPDLGKMQTFTTALSRLAKANMAYDAEHFGAAGAALLGRMEGAGMPPVPGGEGGLLSLPKGGVGSKP